MEELHFKSLFVQNLHPTTSHHLGVMACPETLTSRQLREMATRGFTKQKQTTPLELEGAPGTKPHESDTSASEPYQPPTERGKSLSNPNQGYSQKSWFDRKNQPRDGANRRFSDSYQTQRPFNQWKGSRSYRNREPDRREPRNCSFSERPHKTPMGMDGDSNVPVES